MTRKVDLISIKGSLYIFKKPAFVISKEHREILIRSSKSSNVDVVYISFFKRNPPLVSQ